MTDSIKIAVIGGSGLYHMPELADVETLNVSTPFGATSSDIVVGKVSGKRVAFLPRHGIGHGYSPTSIPYRANIFALKQLGVRFIIAVNACGSLREEYEPGHIVIPDQVFDYTHSRDRSFFEHGLVAHVGVAEPYSPELGDILFNSVQMVGGTVHRGGTFLIEEGPRFATRAESLIFRQWGCSLIGMTTCPEVFLAREAEIAYATMAHVTDYDSWHESETAVTVDMVISTFARNLRIAQQAIVQAVKAIDEDVTYRCHSALANSFMTHKDTVTADVLEQLRPIVGKYFA